MNCLLVAKIPTVDCTMDNNRRRGDRSWEDQGLQQKQENTRQPRHGGRVRNQTRGTCEKVNERDKGSPSSYRDRHRSIEDNRGQIDRELPEKRPRNELEPKTRPLEQGMETKNISLHEEKIMGHRNLRSVVIDGESVACSCDCQRKLNWKGVAVVINHFLERGHKVMAVVPQWAQQQVEDTPELSNLRENIEYSPHRLVAGSTVQSGDDLFILETARATDSVVVSNDNFKDHCNNYPELKDVIETRVLSYGFVDGKLIVPLDPLEKNGSRLEQFLQH